ncbi:MAG: sulfatase-like hydrolase/transferase [Acidobacteria bacterium]|nr:sulfatase-like hydrolase/transferase [Acidobacteriota bacterium]
MRRRDFLRKATATPFAVGGEAAEKPRPNILWISCEDSSPYAFSCYGDPLASTPNIDALAARGVRYTHCYSVAGVCAPTRSGIITGMYPASLGSHFMRCRIQLPKEVRCFPAYLRDAGYYTSNNVKTDYNFGVPKGTWDALSREAHWRGRPAGKPFFAVFNNETSHESRLVRTGEEYARTTPHVTKRVDRSKIAVPPYWPDTPAVREQMAHFYECVSEVDYEAGRLLRELERDGLAEDTIVFFWSDHGVGLPRSKRWNYESGTQAPLIVYIPEKWRVEGQGKPGSVDDQLVSFIDLAPTVLNLAGAPPAKQFQGRAFLGPGLTAPREYVYACHDRMDERYETIRSVRDKRYRYIRNYRPFLPYYQYMNTPEGSPVMKDLRRLHAEGKLSKTAAQWMADTKPAEELYDVENDPHEVKNLSGEPAMRGVLARMRKAHVAWQDQYGDLGLFPEGEIIREEAQLGTRAAMLRRPGRAQLLGALRAVAGTTNASVLKGALAHPEPAIRYWAATGLANLKLRAEALEDASTSVRIAAAMACLRAGEDARAVAVLRAALKDAEEMIRLEAANAVDRVGGKLFEKELEALIADERNETNYPARVANRILNVMRGTEGKVR